MALDLQAQLDAVAADALERQLRVGRDREVRLLLRVVAEPLDLLRRVHAQHAVLAEREDARQAHRAGPAELLRMAKPGLSKIHAHMIRRPWSSSRLSGAKKELSTQLIFSWNVGWNCSSFHSPR